MWFCLLFPLFPPRSSAKGLSTYADSWSHVCNFGVLPILCTLPRTSNNGQSKALPAKRSHDSLQLHASGTVNIHRLWSKTLFKISQHLKCCTNVLFIFFYDCYVALVVSESHFSCYLVLDVWLGHDVYLEVRCGRYIWQSSSTTSKPP